MINIKSLQDVGFEVISKAFAKAFSDYEMQLTSEQLAQMFTRRGYKPELSFGAFDNNEMVSFTINGIGKWDELLTAYDTGTGTVKDYRGQGLAKRIFQESVPVLKEKGISLYLLEVLQHNEKAVNLYKNQGFEVVREFDYFTSEKKDVIITNSKPEHSCEIKEINIPEFNLASSFWDFKPAWQNSFDSVNRTLHDFKIQGAFIDNELVGYGISELITGDITQLAVHKNYRRKGIGTFLFKHLLDQIPGNSINTFKSSASQNSSSGRIYRKD